MSWLNYHHLHYFWMVAREGGIAPAARILRLASPTLSGQIKTLEDHLGVRLFERVGRKLALTDAGRLAYRYADEIFTLGGELRNALRGRATDQPLPLHVGIVDAVPKEVVRLLLEPALALETPLRLVCHEGSQERLLADLALHVLDIVLSDAPLPPGSGARAREHFLGTSGVTWFGAPALVAPLQAAGPPFPRCLDGAPVLLPVEPSPLRRALVRWFEAESLRPRVVAEFADTALLKAFGADGFGLFAGPTAVEAEIVDRYGVSAVGRSDAIQERVFALTAARRVEHPGVVAIRDAARNRVFR